MRVAERSFFLFFRIGYGDGIPSKGVAMKRIAFIAGTRPEVIKLSPLLRLCRRQGGLQAFLLTPEQHRELLSSALAECSLTPDLVFPLSGGLAEKTALSLFHLSSALRTLSPNAVVVQGDTLSAYAGALAAFYQRIPLFHVEAGLRTASPFSPFPEEFYRRGIDTVSTLLFAPTEEAAKNLSKEGKTSGVYVVGNTGIDSLFEDISPDFSHPFLTAERKTVLLTLHRRESLGSPLAEICHAVRDVLLTREDTTLLFPMHPNPEIDAIVRPILGDMTNVTLAPPLDKVTFRNLLARVTLCLSDSGGVSEEATALGTPTLVLRDETERPEGVAAGVLFPVGRTRTRIRAVLTAFLDEPHPRSPSSVFGDGKASERILKIIKAYFT